MFHHPLYRSFYRRQLHWLLLVSLLLQSIGPTALAAAVQVASAQTATYTLDAEADNTDAGNTDAGNTEVQQSKHGLWTISCTGKPMWLPFPGMHDEPAGNIPNDSHSEANSRHCLICSNLSSTDTLSQGSEHFNFSLASLTATQRPPNNDITLCSHNRTYHSRAPPLLTHE